MRWPWSKRKPPPIRLPLYVPPEREDEKPAKLTPIEVDELDAGAVDVEALEALRRAQSRTGMHKAWKRLKGKKNEPEE